MIAKKEKRIKRHRRVRAKIKGTELRPRLSVFRSNRHIWVQLIDDKKRVTLCAASDSEFKEKKSRKTEHGGSVGELIAKKAKELGIKTVVFDRAGYKYHGIVKAVADGARKGGLVF